MTNAPKPPQLWLVQIYNMIILKVGFSAALNILEPFITERVMELYAIKINGNKAVRMNVELNDLHYNIIIKLHGFVQVLDMNTDTPTEIQSFQINETDEIAENIIPMGENRIVITSDDIKFQ